jgi:hypothetical protein
MSRPAVSATLLIGEMKEWAGFRKGEHRYIRRSLHIGQGHENAAALWARNAAETTNIEAQYIVYQELVELREFLRNTKGPNVDENFIAKLIKLTAFDIGQEKIKSFCAYRYLYERLLGAEVRPWLPSAFCAAAALPQIPGHMRKDLLQSISEAAATAPGWSKRQPIFFPERIDLD